MSSLSKIKDNSHKDGWMQKDLLLHLLGKVPDKSDGAEKKIRTGTKAGKRLQY